KPGMICERGKSMLFEIGGNLLRGALAKAVDDAALTLEPFEESQHLPFRAFLFSDGVADVRPVEACNEAVFGVDLQMLQDLAPRGRIRGRRQRHSGRVGKMRGQAVEPAVFGAEIMAPLGE